MVRAIFFDFDGGLTLDSSGSKTTCNHLAKLTGVPSDTLYQCFHDLGRAPYLGQTSLRSLWSTFCGCVGKKIDYKLLDQAFRSTPINKEMFALVQVLRERYKVGIITDNSEERFDAIKDEFKLDDKFDMIIVSADIGCVKDDEKIFTTALQGLLPEEAVFIDNTAKNLEVPLKMGMKTVFFDFGTDTAASLAEKLHALGVK